MMCSLSPLAYVLPVSIRLMPASMARSMIFVASSSGVGSAKLDVPNASGEILTPVRPKMRYFTFYPS
jgi:hypothetical protein